MTRAGFAVSIASTLLQRQWLSASRFLLTASRRASMGPGVAAVDLHSRPELQKVRDAGRPFDGNPAIPLA